MNTRKKNFYRDMLLCLLFFALLHIFTSAYYSDDFEFRNMLQKISLFEYLKTNYYTWSSRILLNASAIYFLSVPKIIWQVVDVLILLLLFYNMYVICYNDDTNPKPYVLLVLMCCYPFKHMGSAGWIGTTTNYLWPLSVGLYVVTILFTIKNKKKIKWYQYIAFIIAMLFGSSSELMAVVLLICLVIAIFYFSYNKIVFSKLCLGVGILIGLSNIIFIMTCPGNANRMEKSVMNYMPSFYELTFIDKIRLNYIAIFEHYVSQPNAILFILCFVVLVGVIFVTKSAVKRIIAGLPMLIDCMFTGYFFILQRRGIIEDDYAVPLLSVTTNAEFMEQFILIIAFTTLIVALLLAMYWIMEEYGIWKYSELLLIMGFGAATRMAVGMSPTMFASYTRIYIFLYFALIMAIALLVRYIKWENNALLHKALYAACISGIILNVITVINTNAAMK